MEVPVQRSRFWSSWGSRVSWVPAWPANLDLLINPVDLLTEELLGVRFVVDQLGTDDFLVVEAETSKCPVRPSPAPSASEDAPKKRTFKKYSYSRCPRSFRSGCLSCLLTPTELSPRKFWRVLLSLRAVVVQHSCLVSD